MGQMCSSQKKRNFDKTQSFRSRASNVEKFYNKIFQSKSLKRQRRDTSYSIKDIADFYEIQQNDIGKGNYGSVRLAKPKYFSKKIFAVKILPKNESNLKFFEKELKIMRELDHPNVISFGEIFVSHDNFYIVMEYCSGENLWEHIKKQKFLNEEKAKIYFYQISKALNYLHNIGIAHWDLKLENCLFKSS